MTSLESIEFWECAGITDAGLVALARLPRLKQCTVTHSPRVTPHGVGVFPPVVRVEYWS